MFIVLWQLHIVLEINPNWIKLCYDTVSMVDEIKGFQDKKYEVYWFDGDHSRTGKHLDRLQGAGYPKIPQKKEAYFSSYAWVPVCFGFGFWHAKSPKPTSKDVNINVLFQES